MTRNVRNGAAALSLAVALTACSAPSQPLLDSARQNCQIGNVAACNALPRLQATVTYEQNQQAKEFAVGALGILGAVAIGAAAAYGASQPSYTDVVVVCRWRC